MRAAVFFVCLCYLLLGGYNYHYAGAHHHSFRQVDAARKKLQQVKFTNSDQEHLIYKASDSSETQEYLLSDDEDNDDDAHHFLVKKNRLLARCYALLDYQSILSYLHHSFKAPPVFYRQISNRYILQGVLRI